MSIGYRRVNEGTPRLTEIGEYDGSTGNHVLLVLIQVSVGGRTSKTAGRETYDDVLGGDVGHPQRKRRPVTMHLVTTGAKRLYVSYASKD